VASSGAALIVSLPSFLPGPRRSRPHIGGSASASEIPVSFLASDFCVEGTLTGRGMVCIAGRVRGDVSVQGQVVVDQTGIVDGAVHANEAIVAGVVRGGVVPLSE
jgi:cytoskeletal protein CcmA (bactofilin family)